MVWRSGWGVWNSRTAISLFADSRPLAEYSEHRGLPKQEDCITPLTGLSVLMSCQRTSQSRPLERLRFLIVPRYGGHVSTHEPRDNTPRLPPFSSVTTKPFLYFPPSGFSNFVYPLPLL